MSKIINEDLALMALLCDKMKFDLFDIQHRRLNETHQKLMDDLKLQLIQLSFTLHEVYEEIKEEDSHLLPEPKDYIPEKPLRTSDITLTKMRKFDGNDEKIDHFH
jgi:hypothetical protein